MVDSSELRDKFNEVEPALCNFQRDSLYRMLEKARRDIEEASTYMISKCPKCGYILKGNEKWKGGGFTNGEHSGSKPMWRCISCNHRFAKDYGQLTWYSQQPQAIWNEVIQQTVHGDGIEYTAANVDISSRTVLRMRHKLLKALEEAEEKETVSLQDQVELDEKYVLYSHKGERDIIRGARKRGEAAAKRGISDEQACMVTGVQRQGTGFIHCWNMGRPSSQDIEHISPLIGRESYAFTDGTTIYDKVLEERACHHVIVDDAQRDSTNHINNVNSFHSAVDLQYRKYRGVATKYINRYCALFKVQKDCQGMDGDEVLIHVLSILRKHCTFMRESDCMKLDVFVAYPELALRYFCMEKFRIAGCSQCQRGVR